MVADETNTAPFAMVSATPFAPNRIVSVWAAFTTTLMTMSAPFAASAGPVAPWPPSLTNRATATAETAQPAPSKPTRRSEVAIRKPIEPSPTTATRGFGATFSGMVIPWSFLVAYPAAAFALGITAWPRCQSMRQRAKQEAAMSETKVREEICRLGRSLFERGLTPGSSGNISVRLDDGGWLVTPTNASLGSLDPLRLSRLDPDGRLASGDAATKEVPLHTAMYQTRRSARAVVHLHSTHSVALSMLPEIDPRAALPPMTPYYLMKCGATALVPYYRPGAPAVADAIRALAGKYASVLLANHGPVVAGDSLEAAVFAMEELEETAKLYLLLRGFNPRYLSPEQVADLAAAFKLPLPDQSHDHA